MLCGTAHIYEVTAWLDFLLFPNIYIYIFLNSSGGKKKPKLVLAAKSDIWRMFVSLPHLDKFSWLAMSLKFTDHLVDKISFLKEKAHFFIKTCKSQDYTDKSRFLFLLMDIPQKIFFFFVSSLKMSIYCNATKKKKKFIVLVLSNQRYFPSSELQ